MVVRMVPSHLRILVFGIGSIDLSRGSVVRGRFSVDLLAILDRYKLSFWTLLEGAPGEPLRLPGILFDKFPLEGLLPESACEAIIDFGIGWSPITPARILPAPQLSTVQDNGSRTMQKSDPDRARPAGSMNDFLQSSMEMTKNFLGTSLTHKLRVQLGHEGVARSTSSKSTWMESLGARSGQVSDAHQTVLGLGSGLP